MPKPASRITRYGRTVRLRKADFSLAKYNLINPSETKFDSAHLGSYAHWASDRGAKVMVVLKDNRCLKAFTAHGGKRTHYTSLPDGTQKWDTEENAIKLSMT